METTKETEKLLRRQIVRELNPHFLFNALLTIQVKIRDSPEEAYRLERDFANYLWAGVEAVISGGMISVKEELKQINAYLNIQQARFPRKLHYEICITQEHLLLPRQMLLIFVENAVRHGIRRSKTGGRLTLEQHILGEEQMLTVRDTGTGFEMSQIREKHGGIERAYRMAESFPGTKIHIESTRGEGTCVTLLLPKKSL